MVMPPILSPEDHEMALIRISVLMQQPLLPGSDAEAELLAFAAQIEEYEREYYPIIPPHGG